MVLQFIDQSSSGIGSSDRRIIRSHVMRGKNKGKPRRSTKKEKNVAALRHLLTAPEFGYKMPRQILWGDLCLTSFPKEMDSASMALMHRCMLSLFSRVVIHSPLFLTKLGFFDISDALFPPQFCTKFDIIKSIWVNCILADEACE